MGDARNRRGFEKSDLPLFVWPPVYLTRVDSEIILIHPEDWVDGRRQCRNNTGAGRDH
jgi:hypothetical protein